MLSVLLFRFNTIIPFIYITNIPFHVYCAYILFSLVYLFSKAFSETFHIVLSRIIFTPLIIHSLTFSPELEDLGELHHTSRRVFKLGIHD